MKVYMCLLDLYFVTFLTTHQYTNFPENTQNIALLTTFCQPVSKFDAFIINKNQNGQIGRAPLQGSSIQLLLGFRLTVVVPQRGMGALKKNLAPQFPLTETK